MSCKYFCDSCGAEAAATLGPFDDWIKPASWFIRPYLDRFQDACSEKCVEKLKEEFPVDSEDGDYCE